MIFDSEGLDSSSWNWLLLFGEEAGGFFPNKASFSSSFLLVREKGRCPHIIVSSLEHLCCIILLLV